MAVAVVCCDVVAQTKEVSGTLKDLSVPVSPAFSLTDITPTLVHNTTTPKAFVLGVVQSATEGGSYFPDNFSAQFAPVWWIAPAGINVYSYLGLPVPEGGKNTGDKKQNIFSGLKFTSLSVGFVNKDLIPDDLDESQKVFSVGIHSTLIKVYKDNRTIKLKKAINDWHDHALQEINDHPDVIDAITRLDPNASDYKAQIDAKTKEIKDRLSAGDLKAINELIVQKPIFVWDISAATAGYSLNNETVQAGRTGVWTGLSFNLPLDNSENPVNYFSVTGLGRYLYDRYQLNDDGVIGSADNFDAGGNLAFEFNRLSIAVEALYRFTNDVADTQNRTVGIISVKVLDNLYFNGTFGKDFSGPNELISLFGVNWGFGKEKVALQGK